MMKMQNSLVSIYRCCLLCWVIVELIANDNLSWMPNDWTNTPTFQNMCDCLPLSLCSIHCHTITARLRNIWMLVCWCKNFLKDCNVVSEMGHYWPEWPLPQLLDVPTIHWQLLNRIRHWSDIRMAGTLLEGSETPDQHVRSHPLFLFPPVSKHIQLSSQSLIVS